MEWLILIGRILWTAIFLGAGMGHLTQGEAMSAYAAAKKFPNAKPVVQVTGIFLVLSSLMVILGVFADLALLLQAVYLVAVAFTMHGFWGIADAQGKMTEMTQFNKNLSLAGAALMLFVLFALGGGAFFDLTVTDSLFTFNTL